MELSQRPSLDRGYWLATLKSFLIWSFTLTVCLLVVGFPLVVLMATIGALSAVALQSVLPISSVLLVAGSIIGGNLLFVLVGAAILTLKGIHPQEVSWLRWLHGQETHSHTAVYASCPLTCSLSR
jgi:CBS-domain-containing membrane protein